MSFYFFWVLGIYCFFLFTFGGGGYWMDYVVGRSLLALRNIWYMIMFIAVFMSMFKRRVQEKLICEGKIINEINQLLSFALLLTKFLVFISLKFVFHNKVLTLKLICKFLTPFTINDLLNIQHQLLQQNIYKKFVDNIIHKPQKMFRRAFMQAFKIRKNGDGSSYMGTVSTNFQILSPLDLKVIKVLSFAFCTTVTYYLTTKRDIEYFEHLFYHFKRPISRTYYQNSIPNNLKLTNDQLMENWNKIHQAKSLFKSFDIQI